MKGEGAGKPAPNAFDCRFSKFPLEKIAPVGEGKMSAEGIEAYKAVIADLKARRTQLDVMIAGLEQQMASAGEGTQIDVAGLTGLDQHSEPTEIRSDTFFGLSIPDAIRKCFKISKRPLSLSEMTASLKAGGLLTTAQNLMQTIGATLQRMKKTDGDVVSLGNGQWGLTEWYPGLRKEKVEATAKPKKSQKRNKRAKGTKPQSEQKPASPKATAEQIDQIKRLHTEGKKPGEIAKEVGLHHFVVMGIIKKAA
jgi:DNA-directed RNA polymerase delta subunit